MSDKFDVVETHSRYCDALDRGDADDLVAVFTEDAVWYCKPMGTFEGHQGLRTFCKAVHEMTPGSMRHTTSNHVVDVTGDTARLRCYLTGIVWDAAKGVAPQVGGAGRYDAQLVRQDGAWKIRRLDVELYEVGDNLDERLTTS
ncbi:nuclear transport factor 2 family protein [Cryptosporangium minutisporangium]|uniref:SnoaL-like domain-containing protein n=1 Tax=Cryptosporangium minutisporangium TaxID=113569 RepID=A0ABP6SYN6_9ACTN